MFARALLIFRTDFVERKLSKAANMTVTTFCRNFGTVNSAPLSCALRHEQRQLFLYLFIVAIRILYPYSVAFLLKHIFLSSIIFCFRSFGFSVLQNNEAAIDAR